MNNEKKLVSDFSGARVGDRVWDFRFGWGTIRRVSTIDEDDYPIQVWYDDSESDEYNNFTFDGEYYQTDKYPIQVWYDDSESDEYNDFTFDGKYYQTDKYPTLFWDEIKFEIPAPPKREVRVRCKAWANTYPNQDYTNLWFNREHSVKYAAQNASWPVTEVYFELTLPEERLVELPFEYEVLS